ncbi:hypothetical protein BGZ93_010461 [Podila epicladia]|nr:hypothetical protein BGZ92_007886 [Podila epicladia]KAG0098748.1 hypothetical protein BGZ93_010461 [Podila epicladia]
MRFTIAAIVASIMTACTVMADQAFPTAPVANTVWNAGAKVNVKWKLVAPEAKTGLTVTLFKGDPAHQTQVEILGTGKPAATSLQVTIPAKLASGWYSVRIGDSWSHYFAIKGTGTMPTGPAPTGIPPTSSGALPVPTGNGTSSATISATAATPTQTNGSAKLFSSASAMVAVIAVAAFAF